LIYIFDLYLDSIVYFGKIFLRRSHITNLILLRPFLLLMITKRQLAVKRYDGRQNIMELAISRFNYPRRAQS